MSHYEERMQKDLDRIRGQVKELGKAVERALRDATRALLSGNAELAADTVIGDLQVNRLTRSLDARCHKFVARHLPSAGVLRYISSVLRLSVALERIGDYAETISRTALQLSAEPPTTVARDIEMMADQSERILHQALKGFNEGSADIARGILGMSGQYASTFDRVFADLVKEGEKKSRPMSDVFSLLATFNRLERVVHQAKNICEETIFASTGEVKRSKKFSILFVDEANDGASQLAAHIATRAYPNSGTYQSAGYAPASGINGSFISFAAEKGVEFDDAAPRPLSEVEDLMSDFHFVVALDAGAREQIGQVPFHTVILDWALSNSGDPRSAYEELSSRIGDLLERLRGEDAS